MKASYLAYLLGCFALSRAVQASQDSLISFPVGRSINGSYKGIYLSKYNQDLFLGVPYAQPPLETRRFRDPQPLTATWIGERPATKYAFVRTS